MNSSNIPDENVSADLSRRKALKVGAVVGVAGAIAASGFGNLKLSNAKSAAPLSVASSLDDLLALLAQRGIIQQFNAVTFFYVPANASISINQKAPIGQVSMINEERIAIGQDHTLQMSVTIDDKEVLFDPDMVQARYEKPLSYLRPSSFYPVQKNFNITLVNKTSKARYFSSLQSGGKIAASDWDLIVVPFLSRALQ